MNVLYNLLTSPLGLPIAAIWEYIILIAVGEFAHVAAWYVSPGGKFGSLIYWLTRLLVFLIVWAVLYVICTFIQWVISNWIIALLTAITVVAIVSTLIVLVRKILKSKHNR